jgi:hypothetical protein
MYVRAYRGTGSRWYRAAHELGHGRIRVRDIRRDVALVAVADDGLADAIDAAYHAKYGAVGSIATSAAARSATIRISAALARTLYSPRKPERLPLNRKAERLPLNRA